MRNLLELLDEPIGAASDPPTHLLGPSVEIALAWISTAPFEITSPLRLALGTVAKQLIRLVD